MHLTLTQRLTVLSACGVTAAVAVGGFASGRIQEPR